MDKRIDWLSIQLYLKLFKRILFTPLKGFVNSRIRTLSVFMLRGINKLNVKIGLIAMAHNLKKYSLTM